MSPPISIPVAAIVAVLKSYPVAQIDLHEENRDEHINIMGQAIHYAGDRAACIGIEGPCKRIAEPLQVVAELIVQAERESALASNVWSDECKPWECDPSKYRANGVVVIVHKARSPWQLHQNGWSAERWEVIRGPSLFATSQAAWESAKMFAGGHGRCKSTAGAFAALADGHSCTSKQSEDRAAEVERVKVRLMQIVRETNVR